MVSRNGISSGASCLPNDAESDLAIHRTAHSLTAWDWVSPGGLVVDGYDEVARPNAGLRRRCLVDWRHHFDETVVHRHFEAETTKLAAVLSLHVLVAYWGQIAGVRIERGERTVDRDADDLAVLLVGGLLVDDRERGIVDVLIRLVTPLFGAGIRPVRHSRLAAGQGMPFAGRGWRRPYKSLSVARVDVARANLVDCELERFEQLDDVGCAQPGSRGVAVGAFAVVSTIWLFFSSSRRARANRPYMLLPYC